MINERSRVVIISCRGPQVEGIRLGVATRRKKK